MTVAFGLPAVAAPANKCKAILRHAYGWQPCLRSTTAMLACQPWPMYVTCSVIRSLNTSDHLLTTRLAGAKAGGP